MRPEDVTEQDIQQWEIARQEYIRENMDDLMREPPAEVWYAGIWLKKQLIALNCAEKLVDRITFAAGQRQSYATDQWQTVVTVVENYKKGIWEEPGRELADKLVKERFGENPDPVEVLNQTLESGIDPEKLLAVVLRHRFFGKK